MPDQDPPQDNPHKTSERSESFIEKQVAEGEVVEGGKGENSNVLVEATFTSHSGPLPPPDILKQYDEILPGSAAQIFEMAQQRQNSELKLQEKIPSYIHADKSSGRRYAFGTVFLMTSLSAWLGWLGHPTAAAAVITGTLFSIVSVFIVGKKTETDEAESESKIDDSKED